MSDACARCGSYFNVHPHRGTRLCREHCVASRAPLAAGVLVVSAATTGLIASSSGVAVVPAVLLVPGAAVVLDVAHVAAHAVLALLGRMRVGRLTFGTGPALARRVFGGTVVELRPLPLGGDAVVLPRGDPRDVRRYAAWQVSRAAGPALLLAAAAYAVARPSAWSLALGVPAAVQLGVDVLAGVTGQHAGPAHSDVHDLARARGAVPVLFDRPAGWSVSPDDYYGDVDAVRRAIVANRFGDVAPAIGRLREVEPDAALWRLAEGLLLLEERRFAEARAALLSTDPHTPGGRGLVANALAWIAGLTGEHLDEAREQVEVALEGLPSAAAAIYDTAALVAARQGRLDEATELSARAEEVGGEEVRPVLSAVRAYVASVRGDLAAAQRWAAEARAHDPANPVLDLIR